ncbi:MAG: endonuclease/exonuclease/phosphatase family protein [Euryarchaeota archaeon]|nr:endonuclease/exonuclease/phosphatase family protein [Euryarchaeota archaeon]
MRRGGWRVVALATLTLFFVESFHRFVPAIYAKNIDTLAIGPSILIILVFLAPLAYLLLRVEHPDRVLLPLAIALAVLRVLVVLPLGVDFQLVFGGLAVGTYLLYLPAHLLRGLRDAAPNLDASGVALGFAADGTARSLFLSADPIARWDLLPLLVTIVLAAFGILALYLEVRHNPTVLPPPKPLGRRGVVRAAGIGLGLGAAWGLQLTILAYPAVLARFAEANLFLMTAAVLAGLGFGIFVVLRGAHPTAHLTLGGNALVALAAVDLVWLRSPFLPLLIGIAQFVIVADFALLFGYLRRAPSLRAAGLALGLSGLVLILYLIAFVFSLVYAFVPGRSLWEGHLPWFLLLATVALAIPAILYAQRSRRHGLKHAGGPSDAAIALTLVVVVMFLLGGLGARLLASPAPPTGTEAFTVMTYNIHQGFGSDGILDLGRIRDVVAAADADLVALQESDTARITSANVDSIRWLSVGLGYDEAYGPPTSRQTFGVGLLSRFPIVTWEVVDLPSVEVQRVAVQAELRIGAETVTVVAVHFGLPREEREAQAAFLLERLSQVPGRTIVLGDLNSCPNGLCPGATVADTVYESFKAGLLADVWTAAGTDKMDPAGFTWPAAAPDRRIDYVFFTAGVEIGAVQVPGTALARLASDHRPVVVQLRTVPPPWLAPPEDGRQFQTAPGDGAPDGGGREVVGVGIRDPVLPLGVEARAPRVLAPSPRVAGVG